MQSLPQDRHEQAQAVWELWLQLEAKEGAIRSGRLSDEHREEQIATKLAELCAPEIVNAVLENPIGRAFCGIRVVIADDQVKITGDQAIIWGGVRRAMQNTTEHREKPIHERIKVFMAKVLSEHQERQIARLQELEAAELVPRLLQASPLTATVILDRLTFQQRHDLLALLVARTESKAIHLRLGLEHEPKDALLWLIWYAARLQATEPAVKRVFTEDKQAPQTILTIGSELGPQPTDKDGEPLNLAGPQLAKAFMRLGRELNKHEHPIKDPESISRIAKSFGVNHARVDRWLREDAPVKLTPDGNGGVYIQFTLEDVMRSVEIAKGRKRGRKPKTS